ncbi:MAG: hypothetical protein M3Z07_03260 [Candidatus Eremiobacteraeota bacterium]|nr:hypothetical protein [Candidatus Eremiobacteraeota bacterium]
MTCYKPFHQAASGTVRPSQAFLTIIGLLAFLTARLGVSKRSRGTAAPAQFIVQEIAVQWRETRKDVQFELSDHDRSSDVPYFQHLRRGQSREYIPAAPYVGPWE